jgi:hypothetical protein
MSNTPVATSEFTPLQQEVLQVYDGGGYAYYTKLSEVSECGDLMVPLVMAEAHDSKDSREEFIRMMRSAARQLSDLADAFEDKEVAALALAAKEAEASGVLMLKLRFHPQAWQNDYAIDADPEGETDWMIPLSDVDLEDSDGELPEDDDDQTDDFRHHLLAPKWVQDWDGPYYVEIVNRDEIEAAIENAKISEGSAS